jgi:hypothetical protein
MEGWINAGLWGLRNAAKVTHPVRALRRAMMR